VGVGVGTGLVDVGVGVAGQLVSALFTAIINSSTVTL
jgi:hypothetical protein